MKKKPSTSLSHYPLTLEETKNKCRRLGYKKIITENGIIKVKVWVKILTREDVDNQA